MDYSASVCTLYIKYNTEYVLQWCSQGLLSHLSQIQWFLFHTQELQCAVSIAFRGKWPENGPKCLFMLETLKPIIVMVLAHLKFETFAYIFVSNFRSTIKVKCLMFVCVCARVHVYLTTLESLQMICSWNISLLSTPSISLRGTCDKTQPKSMLMKLVNTNIKLAITGTMRGNGQRLHQIERACFVLIRSCSVSWVMALISRLQLQTLLHWTTTSLLFWLFSSELLTPVI